MFLTAFLTGYTDMVKTSNDLDRLKFAPQRVENGVFYNFKGEDMFKGTVAGLENISLELIDAERVNGTSRFTQALTKEYFKGFDTLMDMISKETGGVVAEDEPKLDPVSTLYHKLYDIVEAGDKKAFRTIRSELKDQWFAIDGGEVEDAIFDLSDAVADKDVDFAKEIVEGLGGDEVPEEYAAAGVVEDNVPEPTPNKVDEKGLTEEEAEIIEDIKTAIDDGDEKDFNELIAELKEVNAGLAKEWKGAFVVKNTEPTTDEAEDDVLGEILEDLAVAVEENDEAEIKELMEELADEVGEDSDTYKEWSEKVAPKKTRSRRRGK